MSVYNPGIPTGTVNLDQDYLNLQNNFKQLDATYGVNHVKYSVNPSSPGKNGYHTIINQIPQADPAAIAGIGSLYQKTVSGDTQLFFRTGGGGISQLTGNKSAARGFQYIGGVLLQWGIVTISTINANVPLLFTTGAGIDFTTNIFSVQLQLIGSTASSNNSLFVVSGSPSITGFTWRSNANPGDFPSFYWTAIGV